MIDGDSPSQTTVLTEKLDRLLEQSDSDEDSETQAESPGTVASGKLLRWKVSKAGG